MQDISRKLGEHYAETFSKFSNTPEGVDWGSDTEKLYLRYRKMLAVADGHDNNDRQTPPSFLDVGCGYAGLLLYANDEGNVLNYSGIDVAENMIQCARSTFPNVQFYCGDILDFETEEEFDYIVCNGILTQKLDTPKREMDIYAQLLISKMYSMCRKGIAFNVMTTHVNYFSNNLYYRDPVQLMAWCMAELTSNIRIDHAYPLYEYTVYLFKESK